MLGHCHRGFSGEDSSLSIAKNLIKERYTKERLTSLPPPLVWDIWQYTITSFLAKNAISCQTTRLPTFALSSRNSLLKLCFFEGNQPKNFLMPQAVLPISSSLVPVVFHFPVMPLINGALWGLKKRKSLQYLVKVTTFAIIFGKFLPYSNYMCQDPYFSYKNKYVFI